MFIVFTAWNYQVTLIELLAVITSLIGVWLGTTGARITWPWWIISSVLYAILFFNTNFIQVRCCKLFLF